LLFAKQQGVSYAYLGYWVDACASLSYKSRFRPLELLDKYFTLSEEPVWCRSPSP
jgi:arginyl-tRNA--protein-N-Asp/Glu arginylyltransferase